MSKSLKIVLWTGGILLALVLLFYFVIGPVAKKNTKKHSPEQHITHTMDDLELKVFYCSPSKKGRNIFGELVPYGEVWRTGANEATTFTSNRELTIDGNVLPSGTYTLWTIPNEDSWQVIFNSKMYDWGVKITDRKASRQQEYDVLTTEAVVSNSMVPEESFTISFANSPPKTVVMLLSWDDVVVPVPMSFN